MNVLKMLVTRKFHLRAKLAREVGAGEEDGLEASGGFDKGGAEWTKSGSLERISFRGTVGREWNSLRTPSTHLRREEVSFARNCWGIVNAQRIEYRFLFSGTVKSPMLAGTLLMLALPKNPSKKRKIRSPAALGANAAPSEKAE